MNARTYVMLTIVAAVAVFTLTARADPLPGQILKFQQLPLDGPDYWGHDEWSTAYLVEPNPDGLGQYRGVAMADDFADVKIDSLDRQPVVHVRWWGSYQNNEIIDPVDKFLIAFETDIPADPTGGFSRPGQVLLSQVVRRVAAGPTPPGGFTEKAISPGGPPLDETLYEYNAELNLGKWFPEEPDTVYWLKIVALVDAPPPIPGEQPRTVWGWHNRDWRVPNPFASTPPAVVPGEGVIGTVPKLDGTTEDVWHFQDDAVSSLVSILPNPDAPTMPLVFQDEYVPQRYIDGVDGPDGIGQYSKDLAFELYTIPEPATFAVLMLGGVALLRRRR